MSDTLSFSNHSDATPRSCKDVQCSLDFNALKEYVVEQRNQRLPNIERETKTDQILRLLRLTRYRRGKAEHLPVQAMRTTINKAVKANEAIPFRILGFAGKVQNNRCTHTNPDLGDYWALASLEALAQAITERYHPGARIHVYSDATTYPPIFYEDHEPMKEYLDDLKHIAEYCSSLQFKDLQDHLPNQLWARTMQRVRALQRSQYAQTDEFKALKDNAHHLVHADDLNAEDTTIQRRRARQAALRYKAMKDIIRDAELPPQDAIRMTTHPKPGQYGFQLINRDSYNYPWNGVAYIKENDSLRVYDEAKATNKAEYRVHSQQGVFTYTAQKPWDVWIDDISDDHEQPTNQ